MKKILVFLIFIMLVSCLGYYFYHMYEEEVVVEEPEDISFNSDFLFTKAKDLASKPYENPKKNVPDELVKLSYDQHRDIRFSRENGPWYDKNLSFELQFFHLGSIFDVPVPINEIVDDKIQPIKYSSSFFDYGKNTFSDFPDDLGYAGFRLHNPINNAKYYDELVSFLGASYFRALGKGHKYGLSARGLAIDTAVQTGEEFPIFREFWIEEPKKNIKPNAKSRNKTRAKVKPDEVKVHALLDSPSVTGAYSFVIKPGECTVMDVEAVLFTRKNINKLGIAPLTSMFLFGENTKNRFDDHRPEVHDSDGLLLWNGNDEWLWRPLDNSKYLRISSFVDNNPKGFGLMQRDKNPANYLDFEANYEQRPSLWVKPKGDWGKGMVQLVEIPSIQEIHDNIVAYWVPEEEIKAGKEYKFDYSLHWCNEVPEKNVLAKVTATYFGIGGVSGLLEKQKRKFVVDFEGKDLKTMFDKEEVKAEISASSGEIIGYHMLYNSVTGGLTVYMDFQPSDKASELRISLQNKEDKTISEVWSYQWLP